MKEIPIQFTSWIRGSSLMRGKRVKAVNLYKEFKKFYEPRFNDLRKPEFNYWVIDYCEQENIKLEVVDSGGWKWFRTPEIFPIVDGTEQSTDKKINHKQFKSLTTQNFFDWSYDVGIRDWGVINTTEKYKEYIEYPGHEYMTKQFFNNYLRFACLHFNGKLPVEGRCSSGKIMKFKLKPRRTK